MPDPQNNRRRLRWGGGLFLLALIILVGWYVARRDNGKPKYQTVAVARGDLTQVVTATGQINPVVNVQVGCQISGTIQKLYADYNSPVTNGQVVAQLDPATYRANLHQAEGDLANARASLELATVSASRSKQLFEDKLIPQSDYDQAMASLHQAEATVHVKEAAAEKSGVDLARCTIYSPVDGIVISRSVDVGQTVAASLNAPTLFVIANDLAKMQIDANVAEADIGGVETGQDVEFTVDAFPNRAFHGNVVQVRNAPITVQNVVTYDTVIAVDNPELKLKPGMTANVSIVIAQRNDALRIPNAALRFRPPEAATTNTPPRAAGAGKRGRSPMRTVYVLSAGDKLQPAQIKIGISDGVFTEVVDGLKEGDKIVTGSTVAQAKSATPAASPFGGGGMPRRF